MNGTAALSVGLFGLVAAGAGYGYFQQSEQTKQLQAQLDGITASVDAVGASVQNIQSTQMDAMAAEPATVADADIAVAEQPSPTAGMNIDDHLMANPEIIELALAELDRRRTEEAISNVLESEYSPVIGNPDGDVTIVEFFDYNCGFCRQMGVDIRQMVQEDPNLRVVLVELPILSPQSQAAARVSLAAYMTDAEKYEKFHFDLMLGGARIDGDLAKDVAALNLYDLEEVTPLSLSSDIQEAIAANYAAMDALGISGTPAMYVDGQIYPGRISKAQLEQVVAEVRENL